MVLRQALTPAQVNVIDYWEDLESYRNFGYGHPMNSKLQCEAVKDMLRHLESSRLPSAVMYFAHSATIRLFLTAMGFGNDSRPLTAEADQLSILNRKFRTSALAPFASNLAVVKYECPREVDTDKVVFFLNEQRLNLSWCTDGLCSISQVKETYKHFASADCSETFCPKDNRAAAMTMHVISLLLPALGFGMMH